MINIPLLYHGTDARMLEMSSKQREDYLKCCALVIDYLFPFYNDIFTFDLSIFKKKFGNNLGLNVWNAISKTIARNNGNQLYQYGSLYLTNMRDRAINYAHRSFAGGESALIAYRFIQGLDFMDFNDFNPSDEILSAISNIKAFSDDESKDNPVIVTINNAQLEFLQDESGEPIIEFDNDIGSSYRYIKQIDLSKYKIEFLRKTLTK